LNKKRHGLILEKKSLKTIMIQKHGYTFVKCYRRNLKSSWDIENLHLQDITENKADNISFIE
jgi:ribosomal protein S17